MKRIIALLLALMLVLSLAAAASADEALYDNGMTYAEGFPITKEAITLRAFVKDGGSLRPNMDTTEVIGYIADKTNITLEVTLLSDNDQVAMMFVSGDYPDFSMNIGASAIQLADAADAGDIVELTPYIEEVCPTWKAFFEKYSLAYSSCLDANGELYVLPFCNFAPFDRDLRDMFMVNTVWCAELGLETPTTIAEFTDYMRAVRDNAGKGTIPETVEPLNVYADNNVGGYIDIFNFFGVTVADSNWMRVVDGKVEFVPVDEACKEPLHWLQDCYNEGLIKPESFTDDWNMHFVKICNAEPTVGAFFAYNNENVNYFTPISPLDAENGKKPSIRRQYYTANPVRAFTMYSGNKYPYATMRLMDAWVDMSDPAFCETVTMGMQGSIWDYNEDGRIVEGYIDENGSYVRYRDDDPDWAQHYGFWNSFIGIRTPDWYDGPYFEMQNIVPNTRAWAFEEFYKDWVNDDSFNYTTGTLGAEDLERSNELWSDINDYRRSTFANWICGIGDIEAEWDAYVKHLTDDLHLEEAVALRQKAYDLING